MIVVEIRLESAITREHDTDLGTMIIDNVGVAAGGSIGDYRCRMYRKGELGKAGGCARRLLGRSRKPIREAAVLGHRRLAEPVQNLVAKALKEMGYG